MWSLPGVKYLCVLPPTCVWALKHIRPHRRTGLSAGKSGRILGCKSPFSHGAALRIQPSWSPHLFLLSSEARFFPPVSGFSCTIGPGSVVKLRRWSKNKGELEHAQPRGQLLFSKTGVEVSPQVDRAETRISERLSLNAPNRGKKSRLTHSLVVSPLACSPVAKQLRGHHSGAEELAPTFHFYSRP